MYEKLAPPVRWNQKTCICMGPVIRNIAYFFGCKYIYSQVITSGIFGRKSPFLVHVRSHHKFLFTSCIPSRSLVVRRILTVPSLNTFASQKWPVKYGSLQAILGKTCYELQATQTNIWQFFQKKKVFF